MLLMCFGLQTGLYSQVSVQAVKEAAGAVYPIIESDLSTADSITYGLLEKYGPDMLRNDSINAQLLFLTGTLETAKKRYRISSKYLERALETDFVRNNEAARIKCLNNLAICQENLGKLPEAIAMYQQALTIADHLGDRRSVTMALANMAELEQKLGNYHEAISLSAKALLKFEELGDSNFMATCHLNLGKYFSQLQDHEKGEWHTLRAGALYEQMNNKVGMFNALVNRGRLHHLKKRYDQSDQLLQRAINLSRESNFENQLSPVYIQMAGNAIASGEELAKAEEYALTSIRLADTSGRRDILEESYQVLCRYYAKVNDFEHFDQALADYNRVKQETAVLNSRAAAEELKVIFKTEQLNSDVRRLYQDVRLKNVQLFSLSMLLAISILTGSIIYRQHRRLKENTKTLFRMNVQLAYSGNGLEDPRGISPDSDPVSEEAPPDSDQTLYKTIRRRIERDALYKETNLNIQDFAALIRRSRRDVSKAINHVGKTNFPGLINEYKVNEARRLILEQPGSLSMANIATAAGFNSYVTFHRHFKERTGFTPSDYLDIVKQGPDPGNVTEDE